jgi:uncharacterized membrane protein
MSEPSPESSLVSKGRLEFLFDGIFAIAMTLLVLELKVPDLVDKHSIPELRSQLLHHLPAFVSYLLSFFILGMFWMGHNIWYRHYLRITHGMLVFQMIQMALAAFFPFCASIFGKYPTNPLSQIIYMGCCAMYLWAVYLQWILARRSGALAPPPDEKLYPKIQKGMLSGGLMTTLLCLMYVLMAVLR